MRYSLIVPHHSDEARLRRLLSSIPIWREDLEVIVIDDCSADQKALACVKTDWPGVVWLSTTENSGAGAARNVGLRNARGKWLVFADSDDEFLPGAFDVFSEHMNVSDDLVYFLAEAIQEKNGVISARAGRINQLCMRALNEDSGSAFEKLKLKNVVPWAKVYSREFIVNRQLQFEETSVSNDVAFNVLAAVQALNVRIVPIAVYRVFRREGSLTASESIDLMLKRMAVLSRLNTQLGHLGQRSRMHAGSYIYRSLWYGPRGFLRVLSRSLTGGLFWPLFSQLSVREVIEFVSRMKEDRYEKKRM